MSDRLWEVSDIVALLEASDEAGETRILQKTDRRLIRSEGAEMWNPAAETRGGLYGREILLDIGEAG